MSRRFQILFMVVILTINAFALIYLFGGGITGFAVYRGNDFLPSDFVKEEDIYADNESVAFKIENPILSRYEDTGSMLPVLGKTSTGIGINPAYESDINVGDVVSFNREGKIIVHRVIEKGSDSEGVFFVTKGDNNPEADGKVRFFEIESVLIGILY